MGVRDAGRSVRANSPAPKTAVRPCGPGSSTSAPASTNARTASKSPAFAASYSEACPTAASTPRNPSVSLLCLAASAARAAMISLHIAMCCGRRIDWQSRPIQQCCTKWQTTQVSGLIHLHSDCWVPPHMQHVIGAGGSESSESLSLMVGREACAPRAANERDVRRSREAARRAPVSPLIYGLGMVSSSAAAKAQAVEPAC